MAVQLALPFERVTLTSKLTSASSERSSLCRKGADSQMTVAPYLDCGAVILQFCAGNTCVDEIPSWLIEIVFLDVPSLGGGAATATTQIVCAKK